jgi:hypothetical protein
MSNVKSRISKECQTNVKCEALGHPLRTGQARRGLPERKYSFDDAPKLRLSHFGGAGGT